MIVMKLNDINMNVRNVLFLLYENHCSTLLLLLLYCIIIIINIINYYYYYYIALYNYFKYYK